MAWMSSIAARRLDRRRPGAPARFRAAGEERLAGVNQFTVIEAQHQRRPDVVLFVNGMPLAVIELKNPADERHALGRLRPIQTYKPKSPPCSPPCAVVVSDGVYARMARSPPSVSASCPGAPSAARGWREVHAEIQVMVEGAFEKRRFLDLIRHFIVFEDMGGGTLLKKMAGYHHITPSTSPSRKRCAPPSSNGSECRPAWPRARPLHADRQPGGEPGDRRVGVVWHTQGSARA